MSSLTPAAIAALEREAQHALARCARVVADPSRPRAPSGSCVPLLAQGVLDLIAELRAARGQNSSGARAA